jgi:hypothetical protein
VPRAERRPLRGEQSLGLGSLGGHGRRPRQEGTRATRTGRTP